MQLIKLTTTGLIAITVSLANSSTAQAGGCFSQRVVAQQLVAPVVAYPQSYTYYFVGQPIREQAILQKSIIQQSQALQSDPLYQEFLEFKRWREGQNSGQPNQAERLAIETQAAVSAPAHQTIVAITCLKCHSGPEPKGEVSFEGPLSDSMKLKMMQMVWAGKMPPTAPLDNERAAKLFEELLGDDQLQDIPQQPIPNGSLPMTGPPIAPPSPTPAIPTNPNEESVLTPTPDPPIQP